MEMRKRPTATTSSKIGIARLSPFSTIPAIANLPARVGIRFALRNTNSPGIASQCEKRQGPNNIAPAFTEWRHFP